MIKASKVVFISDELEKEFNSLANDDPIKKSITKAIYILIHLQSYGFKQSRILE